MPSTRSCIYALAATGCVATQANAFWLIPGSSRSHEDVRPVAPSATERFRLALQDKYNNIAYSASKGADAVTNSHPVATAKATVDDVQNTGVVSELLRAFDEIASDVSYTTTLAKETLSRGIYLKQDDDKYMLAMDVPGLHTREVVVSSDKGTLRIKGERKCPNVPGTSKPNPLCIPRFYDASFSFPSDADEANADAKLDAGVVSVFVPKLKGESRGFGRVLKLSGEAAEWVYEETGAKTVVDKTSEAANNAADSARYAANAAAASAASAASAATDAASRMVNTVVGSVRDTANRAEIAAEEATASVKSVGSQATYNAKVAADNVANQATRATDAAAEQAARAAASVKSAATKATNTAAANAKAASASVKSAGARATDAAQAEGKDGKGFVERIHEQYVQPIKDRMYSPGSAEGSIPVNKEEL